MKSNELDDAALVEQLRSGSEHAFQRIYEAYGRKLYYFGLSLNLSPADAEEIVQETFERIWVHRQQANPEQSLKAYLITIARNLIYNHIKRNAVRQRHRMNVLQADPQVQLILDTELRSLIDKIVAEMPEKRAQVFKMSRFEGFVNQRIAEELGVSKSTVENHLNKALSQLRKALDQYGYGMVAILFL